MSFEPNIDAAREIFARRVADAYRITWHGFGFVGPEYSAEAAQKLGELAAMHSFPLPAPQMIVKQITQTAILEALAKAGPGRIQAMPEPMTMTYGDDGVVGD